MGSYQLAADINAQINASTTYKSDIDRFGVPEFWDKAAGIGDCEDYVLAKRARLLDAGWPIEEMGICLCHVETGEYHCVLYVETDQGGVILDNRHHDPMDPRSLPYKWDVMLCKDDWRQLLFWL